MIPVPTLDYLIGADGENITKSSAALSGTHAPSLEVVEEATQVFDRLNGVWGTRCDYDTYHGQVDSWAKEIGLSGAEALDYLEQASMIGNSSLGDSTNMAKVNLDKAVSVLARTYLTARLCRDFLWGITDLLRLRLTPAVGYLRVQAETCGLLMLMAESPPVAREWLRVMDHNRGKEFHNRYHPTIVSRIRTLGLYPGYQEGSEVALHSRPWGVSRGVLIGAKKKQYGDVKLVYQEADDPRILFFSFASYLGFHAQVMRNIESLYPELLNDDLQTLATAHFLEMNEAVAARARAIAKHLGGRGIRSLFLASGQAQEEA
jgi:hypothetical protein